MRGLRLGAPESAYPFVARKSAIRAAKNTNVYTATVPACASLGRTTSGKLSTARGKFVP
jgi:hypothetical protein